MGKVTLPPGKKIAVNLGVDFDAQCIWLGSFNYLTPSFMSRGQFGAEVGVPRLLDLFKERALRPLSISPATPWIRSLKFPRKSWMRITRLATTAIITRSCPR